VVKEIQYNKFYKLLLNDYNEKGLSKETFNNHIQRLKEKGIIKMVKKIPFNGIGLGETYISLTPNTIFKKSLGYFELDYSDIKRLSKDNKREQLKNIGEMQERRKLLLFLLLQVSLGYTSYKEKGLITKTELGDIMTLDLPTTEPIVLSSTNPEESFLSEVLDSVPKGSSIFQGCFDSKRFKKPEADDIIQIIEEKYVSYIPLEKSYIGLGGEIIYKIADKNLEDFLSHCSFILRLFIDIICEYYLVLGKRPLPSDFKWIKYILGEERANGIITRIGKNRTEKKSLEDIYIESRGYDKLIKNKHLLSRILLTGKERRPELFNKKRMKNILSKELFKEGILYLEINKVKEISAELRRNDKYNFILDEIKSLINPPFAKKWLKPIFK